MYVELHELAAIPPPGHIAVVPYFCVTEDVGEFLRDQCSDLLH